MGTGMPNGRPLLWGSPEELEEKIEQYFQSITRTKPKTEQVQSGYDEKGKPLYEDKPIIADNGKPYTETEWLYPPSLSALAVHLGVNRMTLTNYANRDTGFYDTIKRAKSRVEAYEAMRLVTTANPKGIEFSLRNNHDWVDAQTLDISHSQALPSYDVSRMTLEQKRALIELIDMATSDGNTPIDVPYQVTD